MTAAPIDYLHRMRFPRLPWLPERADARLAEATMVVQGYAAVDSARFRHAPYLAGRCNVCGKATLFFCDDQRLLPEALNPEVPSKNNFTTLGVH